ncbi:MAG: hypothetical protein M1814_003302 [Vezdaea aestivalis]|nr:MAG: hypothetical protein M1814_003302 [Vezdaea aestivalis]
MNNNNNDPCPVRMTRYEYAKPWGGMFYFMKSYGLNDINDPDQYAEADQIINAMIEEDYQSRLRDWQVRQAQRQRQAAQQQLEQQQQYYRRWN